MKKIIFYFSLIVFVALPFFAVYAQGTEDPSALGYLINCGQDIGEGGVVTGTPCDFNYLIDLFDRFLKFGLYVIVVPLAVLGILRVGYTLVMKSDKSGAWREAWGNAQNVLWGIFLTFGAYLIVKVFLDLVLAPAGSSESADAIRRIFGQ